MPKSEASSPIAKAAQAEKTRERLRALIDGRLGTGADRSDLVRMAVQLIVEEVLEAEARDKLGRERYERAEGEASGYRNGYRRGRMKTAEGGGVLSTAIARDGRAVRIGGSGESRWPH